jgi:hypothetical protein
MTEAETETLSRIRTALSDNPECRPGLLARERVVYAERGLLSHQNDRELFCLVRPPPSSFYGHVLRVRIKPAAEPEFPGGAWVALLVDCGAAIDGATPGEVLASAREVLWEMGRYEPAVYVQDQDDAFKLCGSFEEACAALAEMVRRFVLRLRVQIGVAAIRPARVPLQPYPLTPPTPPSTRPTSSTTPSTTGSTGSGS